MTEPRTANVIGLGLIGGSIAAALRARKWRVAGVDDDEAVSESAKDRELIDSVGLDPAATITFVAVPVLRGTDAVRDALRETTGIVTDVGSVKGPICAAITDSRFVGGHPMAGSERNGLDGADANLFDGAIWVLTPDDDADDLVFARLTAIVSELGAEVLALTPDRHDDVVSVISHVPHLTAASLMGLAADRSIEHAALLRLAAGGFRDMTRVASGRPDIWLDICEENRTAIVSSLTHLIDELTEVRTEIDEGKRSELRDRLDRARHERANLPSRVVHPENLAEVRIPIPDRAGAAAEVFVLAADLSVNIANFEVVHAAERNLGVAVVLIDQAHVEVFRGGLIARGFRPSVQALT
ncbi:prephenate dehydrogenase [Ilumatobacter nonamiensis]|uniref:prephenate dehydrogenase n=1 Tax=Ilumatobacter nonamiensis TaxID=467093 RepID=UPI0003485E61|nr:prephenate dehydrogenase/arogenate dehydrogenase family protein [Ilumatobacter nonamiensis]